MAASRQRWQHGKQQPGSRPKCTRRDSTGWAARDWGTVERTDKEPRRPEQRGCQKAEESGRRAERERESPKESGRKEVKGKAWDGLRQRQRDTHQSPKGGRAGGGGQPQPPPGQRSRRVDRSSPSGSSRLARGEDRTAKVL